MRVVTTSMAMLVALMTVALADPAKERPNPAVQSAAEARPIRVILPAPWEPAKGQAETTHASK